MNTDLIIEEFLNEIDKDKKLSEEKRATLTKLLTETAEYTIKLNHIFNEIYSICENEAFISEEGTKKE